jgi:hypothetical protein
VPQPPDFISESKKMHKEYKYFRWTCTGRERWQTWAIGNSKIYGCPKGHRMRKGVEVHVNEVLRDVFGKVAGDCDD